MACVRVCPADAVAVEGAIVRIVDEACTRCGLCLPACPHDAIEAVGDVPRALELALAGRAALILSVECAVYFYPAAPNQVVRSEEHTSELQSQSNLVCRLLLEKKKKQNTAST